MHFYYRNRQKNLSTSLTRYGRMLPNGNM